MTISVPVSTALISTDVVDNTTAYDPTIRAYYQTGQEMQDNDLIYSYYGESFIPADYLLADEPSYVVDQVLFKDATTVKVIAVGEATVPKQPEEYTAVADTTFTFNTWTKPWSIVQTDVPAGTYNGYTKVVSEVTHQLYRDATSSTGWMYKISYPITVTEGPFYSNNFSILEYKFSSGSTWYWDSSTAVYKASTSNVISYVSGIYTYYRGALVEENTNYYMYAISRVYASTATYQSEARVYTSLDDNSIISNAYCADAADCANRWIGRTFVLRGSDLYVRTNSGTIETKVVNVPQYSVIDDLGSFPNFALIGVIDKFKPFDGKNYTSAITNIGTMTYEVQANEAFDTIALGNVNAQFISITFYDELDVEVLTVSDSIDTSRDTLGNLKTWYTTLVYYASTTGLVADAVKINPGGKIIVTLTSSEEIRLSTLMAGISAQAGMTNLQIKNDYKDFSSFGYDEFGNPDYVERARVSRYSGTVSIPVTDYDKTDRLMSSLGKNLVIVNGSDSSSAASNGTYIFASTQKIGRFMSFSQQTKVTANDMDVMATYAFTLEEIV